MSIIFIKYSLLNFIFIKQVILHLKCSVSSTVTNLNIVITSDAAILHNIAKFLYLELQLLMNNPNLARQCSVITQNMKLTRNHYSVRYKRESFFSADNDSYLQQRAAAILKKCPKMRPGCTTCVLLTVKSQTRGITLLPTQNCRIRF